MPVVAGYAERFGVYDRMGAFLANSLGSEETTLYKMVAAYAMFANGGERVEPTLVDRIQDRFGKTIYRHDDRQCLDCNSTWLEPDESPQIVTDREQVMDAITAYQLTSMMKGVVDRGTASRVVNLPVPTAGKTGTTNESKDAWFIGFTSNIVAGCYIGYDRPRPMGRGAYGGTMCGPVFQSFMEKAVEKYGGGPFEVPPGGHFIKIDRFSGARLPEDASRGICGGRVFPRRCRRLHRPDLRRRLCHGIGPATVRRSKRIGSAGDNFDRKHGYTVGPNASQGDLQGGAGLQEASPATCRNRSDRQRSTRRISRCPFGGNLSTSTASRSIAAHLARSPFGKCRSLHGSNANRQCTLWHQSRDRHRSG